MTEDLTRAFVALWPPGQIIEQVAGLIGSVAPTADSRWRWTRPQRLHVTVVYLGDMPPHSTARIAPRLRSAAADTRPEQVSIGGAGRFGPVLWLQIDTGPWLRELHRILRPLVPAQRRETRYRPHLTIGRWRGPRPTPPPPRGLSDQVGTPLARASWVPEALSLVHSPAGGGAGDYVELARFPMPGSDARIR